jgi:hypothetical protein
MVITLSHPPPASPPASAPQVRGADGSLMLDKFQFLQPENAYDAFALFV